MSTISNKTGDGDYVVIQNGQRVTAATPSQQEAQQEADRRNKLVESNGQPVPEQQKAQVKRNLCG